MPIGTPPPTKIPLSKYWALKLKNARTESERLGIACNYLRAMAKRYPDQRAAQAELERFADDLTASAKTFGKRVR